MKRKRVYTCTTKLWIYPGESANWHFVTVPRKESGEMNTAFHEFKRGWGSLPVLARIRKTAWNTSIFPDTKSGTYLLPIKADVRRKEGLESGDSVPFTLTILPSLGTLRRVDNR